MENPKITICQRYRFSASHRLFNPRWTKHRNLEVFGKCTRLHGHNYLMEIQVRGRLGGESGMLINFTELSRIVHSRVVDYLDHRDLNQDIPELKGQVPTVENLIVLCRDRLKSGLPRGVKLGGLRLFETENCWAELAG
jgi:6-pyruvoyltetrahydropterin/6-carboxytetrahydropterin synthase